MSEKQPPDRYYYAEAVRINSELPLSVQVTEDNVRVADDALASWGSGVSVREVYEQLHGDSADGPAVPEPRPFDCPVCEHVGFDCGGHGA